VAKTAWKRVSRNIWTFTLKKLSGFCGRPYSAPVDDAPLRPPSYVLSTSVFPLLLLNSDSSDSHRASSRRSSGGKSIAHMG